MFSIFMWLPFMFYYSKMKQRTHRLHGTFQIMPWMLCTHCRVSVHIYHPYVPRWTKLRLPCFCIYHDNNSASWDFPSSASECIHLKARGKLCQILLHHIQTVLTRVCSLKAWKYPVLDLKGFNEGIQSVADISGTITSTDVMWDLCLLLRSKEFKLSLIMEAQVQ